MSSRFVRASKFRRTWQSWARCTLRQPHHRPLPSADLFVNHDKPEKSFLDFDLSTTTGDHPYIKASARFLCVSSNFVSAWHCFHALHCTLLPALWRCEEAVAL